MSSESQLHCVPRSGTARSEEHTSELQSHLNLVCRLLLYKKSRSVSVCDLCAEAGSARASTTSTVTLRHRDPLTTSPQPSLLVLSLTRCLFFNDTATTEIYTLSLHDALPISRTLTHPPIHTHTIYVKHLHM